MFLSFSLLRTEARERKSFSFSSLIKKRPVYSYYCQCWLCDIYTHTLTHTHTLKKQSANEVFYFHVSACVSRKVRKQFCAREHANQNNLFLVENKPRNLCKSVPVASHSSRTLFFSCVRSIVIKNARSAVDNNTT